MSDSLREYLVSLGFRVDEASWKKYVGYVALAGKTTAELGSVAVEAATAIEVAVAKVARQYESLYYVSARTGKSANYIQAAQFAYRQMGLSADDATSAIEGVAHAMRTTPGLSALFGGATKPEDIVERLRGLAESSTAGYAVASRMAGMAGIPEQTFQHFILFGQQEKAAAEDHRKRLQEAGIDAHKFADRVSKGEGSFTWALNRLEDEFDILGTRIAVDWIDPTQKGINVLDRAVQWFNRTDTATKGWISTLGSLAVTLTGLFGVEKVLSKLLGFGGTTLTGTVAGKLLGGRGLLGKAVLGGGVLGLSLEAIELMKNDKDNSVRDYIRGMITSATGIDLSDDGAPASKPTKGDPRGMLAVVRAAAIKNGIDPDVMQIVAQSEGLNELYAGTGAGGDYGTSFGAMQLHRGGRGSVGTEYERATGHNLNDPKNEAEEIEFAAEWAKKHGWGAWAGAKKNNITGFAGIDGAMSGASVHTGDRFVTINQKTDIHVTGGGAEETANRVFRKQIDVNNNIVRNAVGAHR